MHAYLPQTMSFLVVISRYKHKHLPGFTPELNLAGEQSLFWYFIWDAGERSREGGDVTDMMRHARNHYNYLIRRIKKNGYLAVRSSLSNALLHDLSRDYWTEVKKIHKNKSSIKNRVDDKTGSVDIANEFADQYSILYSSVPSEPTCLSELLMRIKTSVRNTCQHNYFGIQHCHFVNSTQISDVIQILRVVKSDEIDNLYSDNFKHVTCHLLLIVCYVMDMHPPVFFHAAVIPIPKNTTLNLSSSCNYRTIALSSIF